LTPNPLCDKLKINKGAIMKKNKTEKTFYPYKRVFKGMRKNSEGKFEFETVNLTNDEPTTYFVDFKTKQLIHKEEGE